MANFQANASGFNTFASMGGCDIIVLMDGELVGNLQAISISISREKAPIHTLGRPDARGFSRGKRGIAGSMVGVVFQNSWLAHTLRGNQLNDTDRRTYFYANEDEYVQYRELLGSVNDDSSVNEAFRQVEGGNALFFTNRRPRQAWYVDQILPFNTVVVGANEYGGATARIITSCEILNEATGTSVDDIMLDESHTYVALHVSPFISLEYKNPITGAVGAAGIGDLFDRARSENAPDVFEDLTQG